MINILDKQTADKIAAGEVIERPVSIIKELIENSIDAGADSVVVEIKKGGKAYIRVTDNGCGIAAEEAEKAFLRHATSKISTVSDLDAIQALGFRGEALASVCAVTRTELLTKRKDDKVGTDLIIHGGEVISKKPSGCPDGTTLIITDLFYNTPARLKFMKSDSAETAMITDLVSQLALAYDDISFRLINNGSVLFSTSGDGNRLNIISRVFPNIDIENLVPVDHKADGLSLTGHISTPAVSRTGKNGQIFFVNGRVVNSRVMEKGVAEGYRERLFEGRYPIAFLFLNVDSSDLDVNIHPNKRAVRFDREKDIQEFIAKAVKEALGTKEAVVRAANIFRDRSFLSEAHGRQAFPREDAKWGTSSRTFEEQVDLKNIMSTNSEGDNGGNNDNDNDDNDGRRGEAYGGRYGYEGPAVDIPIKKVFAEEVIETPPLDEFLKAGAESETGTKGSARSESGGKASWDIASRQRITLDAPLIRPFDFDAITVTGVIFGTYITAADDDNFYLFDQHAAHERIFYEKLVGEYDREEKLTQPILMPILINVPAAAESDESRWMTPLRDMGFVIENFGPGSYRISEIPTFMGLGEAEDFARDFIENIDDKQDLRNTAVIDKLIMRSCKSAVKAHDRLSEEEISALMKDLKACVNPFSCPHGRPTFIKLSNYEIERLFKRA